MPAIDRARPLPPKQRRPRTDAHKGSASASEGGVDDGDEEEKATQDDGFFEATSLSLANAPIPLSDPAKASSIAAHLARFTQLNRLDLSHSRLHSTALLAQAVTISAWHSKDEYFGRRLTWLNASGNEDIGKEALAEREKEGQRKGQVWSGIELLPALFVLNLSNCKLPSPPPLHTLPNLRALILSHNDLSGTLPAVPLLPNLNTLVLSYNNLTGLHPTLPASLPSLAKLSITFNDLGPSDASTGKKGEVASTPAGQTFLPDFTSVLTLREVRLSHNPRIAQATSSSSSNSKGDKASANGPSLPAHLATWARGTDGSGKGLAVLELSACGIDSWDQIQPFLSAASKGIKSDSDNAKGPSEGKGKRAGLATLNLKNNGICATEGYRERILAAFPTLRTLDDIHVDGGKSKGAKKSGGAQAIEDDEVGVSEAVANAYANKKRKADAISTQQSSKHGTTSSESSSALDASPHVQKKKKRRRADTDDEDGDDTSARPGPESAHDTDEAERVKLPTLTAEADEEDHQTESEGTKKRKGTRRGTRKGDNNKKTTTEVESVESSSSSAAASPASGPATKKVRLGDGDARERSGPAPNGPPGAGDGGLDELGKGKKRKRRAREEAEGQTAIAPSQGAVSSSTPTDPVSSAKAKAKAKKKPSTSSSDLPAAAKAQSDNEEKTKEKKPKMRQRLQKKMMLQQQEREGEDDGEGAGFDKAYLSSSSRKGGRSASLSAWDADADGDGDGGAASSNGPSSGQRDPAQVQAKLQPQAQAQTKFQSSVVGIVEVRKQHKKKNKSAVAPPTKSGTNGAPSPAPPSGPGPGPTPASAPPIDASIGLGGAVDAWSTGVGGGGEGFW